MNLFEYIYPRFYFNKTDKIRIFEAFSGVGCQAMALKRITDNYELVGFSEIDKYAIQSYKAIHGEVKNYGDITKMETIPECDIFTYSFPCQDLSLAGKQKGLGQGTRSGLVYEVLRLLRTTAGNFEPNHRHIPLHSKTHSMGYTDYYQPIPDKTKLPKVLIMENVSALISATFVNQFNEIQLELEKLGYKNYNEVLNAKDYGIPQNRERIFMVSILGDYSYTFPEPIKLELRLKDLLEENVDEKYYLSEKALQGVARTTFQSSKLESRMEDENGIMTTLCARDYKGPKLVQVAQFIAIKEATEKGYAEAKDGDGVYINRPQQKRGVVQKGMIQTIKTSGNDIGVVMGEYRRDEGIRTFKTGAIGTIRTKESGGDKVVVTSPPLRIRKLTPRECWRLMGISDADFDKAQASGMSNAQLYKQAGNGIVVNVFEAILKNLFKGE